MRPVAIYSGIRLCYCECWASVSFPGEIRPYSGPGDTIFCLIAVLCGETESNCNLHTNTKTPNNRRCVPDIIHTRFQYFDGESASRYFFGRWCGIVHEGVGSGKPQQFVSGSSILLTPGSEEPIFFPINDRPERSFQPKISMFLLISAVNYFNLNNKGLI